MPPDVFKSMKKIPESEVRESIYQCLVEALANADAIN